MAHRDVTVQRVHDGETGQAGGPDVSRRSRKTANGLNGAPRQDEVLCLPMARKKPLVNLAAPAAHCQRLGHFHLGFRSGDLKRR